MMAFARVCCCQKLIARAQIRGSLHRIGRTHLSARAGVAMGEVRRSAAQLAGWVSETSGQGPAVPGRNAVCLP